jgi:CO dehydrogenase/acetyl-CoA synthase epsilon subunit
VKQNKPNTPKLPSKFELTDEEKEELQAEASKIINSKRHKAAREQYLQHVINELMKADDPGNYEMETFIIDVAGHADRIVLDGTVYYQGQQVIVSANKAATIREIMWRTHQHEAEIGFANRDYYRPPVNRPKDLLISPSNSKGISLAGARF